MRRGQRRRHGVTPAQIARAGAVRRVGGVVYRDASALLFLQGFLGGLVEHAGTGGGHFELAFGVAGVAAVFAREALGANAPDALLAEVAVGGDLEGGGFEFVGGGTAGEICN